MGHAYVDPDDAIVSCIIFLCSDMCHMDLIDVILSRMTSMSSSSILGNEVVSMASYVRGSNVHGV